jgi:hypothetical protein
MSVIEEELEHRYQEFIFRSRHSIWITSIIILAINALLFLPVRIWEADLTNAGIDSKPQLLGMVLLFILVPMWMFACFFATQRHSLALARQLEAISNTRTKISNEILRFPMRQVIIGFAAGLLYALAFSIPSLQIASTLNGEWGTLSITVGQLTLSVCVGILLSVRLHIAGLFSALGKEIEFSIFEQTPLQAFAKVGMLDVVIVVGGMAIATVQSLDAQFRLENYLSAVVIAAPAALALLYRPMREIHKRMLARKKELLAPINALIAQASEASTSDDIRLLEELLQRRDRILALHTWPLDISIWRRLAFYVLIPPLAWAGAALMEVFVNRVIGA